MVSMLLSNEDGRKLASNETASKFEFLRTLPRRSTQFDVKVWLTNAKGEIKGISEPVSGFGQTLSKINSLGIALEATEKQYRDARQAIEQLLKSSTQRNDRTLASAISSLDRTRDDLIAQKVNEKLAAESRRQEAVIRIETDKLKRLKGELSAAKKRMSSVSAISKKAIRHT